MILTTARWWEIVMRMTTMMFAMITLMSPWLWHDHLCHKHHDYWLVPMSLTDTSGLMHLGWLRVSFTEAMEFLANTAHALSWQVEPLVPTQNQCPSEISDYKCTYYVPHPEISTKSTQKIRSWLQVSPRIHNTLHLPTKRRGAKPYEPWSMPRENSWASAHLTSSIHPATTQPTVWDSCQSWQNGQEFQRDSGERNKSREVVLQNPYQAIQQSENGPFKN